MVVTGPVEWEMHSLDFLVLRVMANLLVVMLIGCVFVMR